MSYAKGSGVLHGRYTLVGEPLTVQGDSETWRAVSHEDRPYLARLWPYPDEKPPELLRALWDSELRTLYRLASAPGADESILTLKDAGLDREAKSFVMILEAKNFTEYERLSEALSKRQSFKFLKTDDYRTRLALWKGLQRIVNGIRLLHYRNTIHRSIDPDIIYFDPAVGPSSLTLGGFEWTVRLGIPASAPPPETWSTAPELCNSDDQGFSTESDWYAFGVSLARCFFQLENIATQRQDERYDRMIRAIQGAPKNLLSQLEKSLILEMLAQEPLERLTESADISNRIDDICTGLDHQFYTPDSNTPLLISVNQKLVSNNIDILLQAGYQPNPDDPDEPFNPNAASHTFSLLQFIQAEFDKPSHPVLHTSSREDSYICTTKHLVMRLLPLRLYDQNTGEATNTYDALHFLPLSGFTAGGEHVSLRAESIAVQDYQAVKKRLRKGDTRSWKPFLPVYKPNETLRYDLTRYHTFVRATNQIELLMKEAEIYAYKIVKKELASPSRQLIQIKERERERPPYLRFESEGGMVRQFQEISSSQKPHCKDVILTEKQELRIPQGYASIHTWQVENISIDDEIITLSRQLAEGRAFGETTTLNVPDEGYIREWGLEAQLQAIERRMNAIERLKGHSFLLKSISGTGQVYIDTEIDDLPITLSPDVVDEAKQAVLGDILRTRPMYCLEGPPGTGKTTLVAYLLKQIFQEDPVAQILITAQAHDAVDVLRKKVDAEIFNETDAVRAPLAIRIHGAHDKRENEVGSVYRVSLDMLITAAERLASVGQRTKLQDDWRGWIFRVLSAVDHNNTAMLSDFSETVKRGASITFCTTSAGDLASLSNTDQSYDWAIVEEAGKVYPFELALPMQMGNRWLLIGDHKQLPPYRYDQYLQAVTELDKVANALRLVEGDGKLLDRAWLKEWGDYSDTEKDSFIKYSRNRLFAFKHFFELCRGAPGEDRLTGAGPNGAAAGELTIQHRMHPDIGQLISTVFYKGRIKSETEDLVAIPNIGGGLCISTLHPKPHVTHGLAAPAEIRDRAIVWVDMTWAKKDFDNHEKGGIDDTPRFTNPGEVDTVLNFVRCLRRGPICDCEDQREFEIACLAPYARQVFDFNSKFEPAMLPTGFRLMPPSKRGALGGAQFAHTVDSFQGNQADVVVVSLVRNNLRPQEGRLGFLKDAPRLNVMLSRAKRLLVICGSWEFFEQAAQYAVSEADETWHWKQVIAVLAEISGRGRAVKFEPGQFRTGSFLSKTIQLS